MLTAAVLLQTALGVFFGISGFHKTFHPARRQALAATLEENNIPGGVFMCYWVAGWELLTGLVAGGAVLWHMAGLAIVPQLAMVPMVAILLVAALCEAQQKIASYQPINKADWLADLLYLPEVLMLVMASAALAL